MSYSSYPIAGLSIAGTKFFYFWRCTLALGGPFGRHDDPAVTETYSFDDTCFGAQAAGVVPRLASCALGPLVQVRMIPLGGLGHAAGFDPDLPTPLPTDIGGHLQSMSATMGGAVVDVVDDVVSTAAGALTPVLPGRPYVVGGGEPFGIEDPFLLLRPETLRWSGQDTSNDANRTIWHVEEIASVHVTFTITAPTISLNYAWLVWGWTSP